MDGNVEKVGLLGDMLPLEQLDDAATQSLGINAGECGGKDEQGVGGDGELAVLIEWNPELMRSAGFSESFEEDVLEPSSLLGL